MKSRFLSILRTSFVAVAAVAAATTCLVPAVAFAGGKKAPAPRPAKEYAVFETHPAEKVTVAIDPCMRQDDCDFFRLPYIRHSMIPVRVIITNDSDTTLDLDEARMQFISGSSDRLPAATQDDLNRRLFSTKQAKGGSHIPLTPIPIHHAPIDKKIMQDDEDFGFRSTQVTPHSTMAGYLFYDVKDLDEPPLKGAEIYVKMIRFFGGKELFAFTLPFDKWLATQKSTSNHASQ